MAKYPGGVTVSGYIAPSDTLDTYATHKAQFGHGGYRSVADIAARDAITVIRREIGMVAYVISEDKEYRLVGGIENTNWVELIDQVGTGSGGTTEVEMNYIIVGTLYDVENYPLADRKIGMILYASDVDREFRLVHGIDNVNLVEQNLVTTSGGDTNNYYNNNYYNSIGCLNKSLMMEAILNLPSPLKSIYTTPNGTEVVSANDANIFSFIINKSDYWAGDWVYFRGTSNIDPTKVNETFMEISHAGDLDIINIGLALSGTTYSNFEIFGSLSSWYGYFKKPNPGKVDLKVYETQDGITAYNINKTVYLFSPNFVIKDGVSNTPLDITGASTTTTNKDYNFDVISNTSFVVSLVKVNVTSKGIDTTNYNVVPSTMLAITSTGLYTIPYTVLNNLISGTYAILVTGKDGGVNIPPYFYGPFIINNN